MREAVFDHDWDEFCWRPRCSTCRQTTRSFSQRRWHWWLYRLFRWARANGEAGAS